MMTGMRIVCTLGAGDLAAQRKRWGRLIAASALERTERPDGLRIRFRPGRGVADDLRALAATERECCAWARWSITVAADRVVLDITSTGIGITALHSMFTEAGRI
jgi:uncharacterized membrane protein YidH (DUF202 family)